MYENHGQHIRERIQTCHPKGKTYRDAQLRELVQSIVEKVKLLLNSSHLEPQVVKPPHHHGDDDSE
jgi:hypothetical protein